MKKPVLLFLVITAALESTDVVFGYRHVYQVSYGAFSIMAAFIALTFYWLWSRRSTPLALGMAFGWAGAASVMAWWWLYTLFGQPDWMTESPFLFVLLAFYFVGAILHLEVICRSFGYQRWAAYLPLFGSLVISFCLTVAL